MMDERAVTMQLYCRCGAELVGGIDTWDSPFTARLGGAGRWCLPEPAPYAWLECSMCGFFAEGHDALAIDAAFRNGML